MNAQLPEEFTPPGALVQSVVGPAESVPPGEETVAAVLRDLASIGEHVQGAGVLRVARGRALVNQQRVDSVMRELAAAVMEIQQKPKKTRRDLALMAQLAHAFGGLAARQTESQHLLLAVEQASSPGEPDAPKPLNEAFPAGAIVGQRPVGC
jgi:hypothetical protein